jgi:hypothetical protein
VIVTTNILVVRCPYCVLGDEFRPMAGAGSGRFVCAKCGHLAVPDDQNFACHCRKCDELRTLDSRHDRNGRFGQTSRPNRALWS